MWIKVVASGIFLSNLFAFVFSVLNFLFWTTVLFTTSLFYSNLQEPFSTYQHVNHPLLLKLFMVVETLTNLLMSSLSTLAFKSIKSLLAA